MKGRRNGRYRREEGMEGREGGREEGMDGWKGGRKKGMDRMKGWKGGRDGRDGGWNGGRDGKRINNRIRIMRRMFFLITCLISISLITV